MTDELIKTIAWCVVLAMAIQGVSTYAVVRLLTTGRPLFERRPSHVSEFTR